MDFIALPKVAPRAAVSSVVIHHPISSVLTPSVARLKAGNQSYQANPVLKARQWRREFPEDIPARPSDGLEFRSFPSRYKNRTGKVVGAVMLLTALICWGCRDNKPPQGIEWKTLNDELTSLYRQGQYDRAVVVAKKALQVAEQAVGPNHPSVATSLNNLALLYFTQGQYAQAEPLFKRALAIDEKALGRDHPDVATDLNNLADRKSVV